MVEEKKYALGKIIEEEGIMEENTFSDMIEEIDELGENTFSYGLEEYLVLTKEEAEARLRECIKQSLWAFNPSFLERVTGLPGEAFEALAEKCESGNNAVLSLVEKTCGINKLIEEAVKYDGRGHFLADYDGVEHVSIINRPDKDVVYYIYRIN